MAPSQIGRRPGGGASRCWGKIGPFKIAQDLSRSGKSFPNRPDIGVASRAVATRPHAPMLRTLVALTPEQHERLRTRAFHARGSIAGEVRTLVQGAMDRKARGQRPPSTDLCTFRDRLCALSVSAYIAASAVVVVPGEGQRPGLRHQPAHHPHLRHQLPGGSSGLAL